jgi:hypothetical protein
MRTLVMARRVLEESSAVGPTFSEVAAGHNIQKHHARKTYRLNFQAFELIKILFTVL